MDKEFYTCRFIESGLVGYGDNNLGVWLINKNTIDNMLPSFVGKPVFINHSNNEKKSVGTVANVYYNNNDGWYYADFTIDDQIAKGKIIKDNWSVSCAYAVTDCIKEDKIHNALHYNFEVRGGVFVHLALTPNPRYENAIIFKKEKNNMTDEEKDAINGMIAEALTAAIPNIASQVASNANPEPAAENSVTQTQKFKQLKNAVEEQTAMFDLIKETEDAIAFVRASFEEQNGYNPSELLDKAIQSKEGEERLAAALRQLLINESLYYSDGRELDEIEAEINALPLDVLRDRAREAKKRIGEKEEEIETTGMLNSAAKNSFNPIMLWLKKDKEFMKDKGAA